VQVGEFAVIGEHAVIGADSRIANHAIVRAGCVLGTAVSIDSFAVLGGHPQSRAPGDLRGHVEVGDRTVVREGVTINMPTQPGGVTAVGSDCMLMANSHVGHDCVVGNSSTLANNVMLAGHVCVGDSVFLGGGVGIHQFVRVGTGAMVSGNASMSYDVPPYVIAAERNQICGLNVIGLRRAGVSPTELADLKRCYHAVFCDTGDLRTRASRALESGAMGHAGRARTFLEFFATGRRGFAQARKKRDRGHCADTT
jgi:UDP-N-acetylglucosamine acyltransferase